MCHLAAGRQLHASQPQGQQWFRRGPIGRQLPRP